MQPQFKMPETGREKAGSYGSSADASHIMTKLNADVFLTNGDHKKDDYTKVPASQT